MSESSNRGTWSSRHGFVLAATGSAVGLGNIWGFPTQVGQGGGAAFVLIYLVCVAFICFPIMIAELAIGRNAGMDPVGSFHKIKPNTSWWLLGALGVLAGAGILSFYSVIAGWTVAYIWFSGTGAVSASPEAAGEFFNNFTQNGTLNFCLTLFILIVTATIIISGVRSGIERVAKTMMPVLGALLVILAIRAVTLPGAAVGLAYYLSPDLSKILDLNVISAALGQAFFSLSLGMGAMITYGSYLNKKDGIATSAGLVVLLDTSIALLAGLIIFPSGFSIPDFDPTTSGPGLIFTVLPRLFATLPGGQLFGAAFFVLLSIAALTSAISLLEVPVAHLIDVHKWKRSKAAVLVTIVIFVLSVPSFLANQPDSIFSDLPIIKMDFLTLMATIWNNFALPIGGLLTALFVGYAWGVDRALEELRTTQAWFPKGNFWGFLIKYVCPLAILSIIFSALRSIIG